MQGKLVELTARSWQNKTLLHEVGGHLLITFLSNGHPITPPTISAPCYGNQAIGEAGRYFELVLFGGTTEYYRDPAEDDGQVV
jgi:hypothetical protein